MKRLTSIDVLKTAAAVLTLFFHCNMHLDVQFLFLTPFISQGAVVMDLFFILSGYTLFAGYRTRRLSEQDLPGFYRQRLISIYPMYALIMAAFWLVPAWRSPALQTLVSLPVELCLLQSWFSGMFGFFHNGGTWFLSCLAFCYAVFPLLLSVVRTASRRLCRIMQALCWLLCALIPFMILLLAVPNVYSNPLLRMLQFLGGILLALELGEMPAPRRCTPWLAVSLCSGVVLIAATTWLWSIESLRNAYVTYGVVTYPIFLLLIAASIRAEQACSQTVPLARFWKVCGDHAYAMFMAQFFLWAPIRHIKEQWPQGFAVHGNWKTLLLASMLCVVLTVLLQDCYNVPVQQWLRSHFNKKERTTSL